MLETLTRILARHADDLLSRVTGDRTDEGAGIICRPDETPDPESYELAAVIEFEGRLAAPGNPKAIGGHMLCGALKSLEVQPFLAAMTAHVGLDPAILKTADGPLNILSEFLNILIGLTAADWAERGCEIDFSTPRNFSGRTPPAPKPGGRPFHIDIRGPDGLRMDLVVVFNEKNDA